MLSPDADDIPEPGKEYLEERFVALPDATRLTARLGDAIARRESVRTFSDRPISLEQLATVLHHALGVRETSLFGNLEFARRPCPSPGGLYPLELYVFARRVDDLTPGIYHYQACTHGLTEVCAMLPSRAVETYLFMDQPYAAEAPVTLVISCMFGRSVKKYGDRGYRYALIEAGHVFQNAALVSSALNLGSCPLGGILDSELGQVLGLDPELEAPLYALAVGQASSAAAVP